MRLALLSRQNRREIVGVRQHRIGEIAQNLGALLGQQLAPANLGTLGCLDCSACLRCAHPRHLRELLARRRVDHGEGLATIGIDPLAVDIGLGAEEVGIGKHQRHAADTRRLTPLWSDHFGSDLNSPDGSPSHKPRRDSAHPSPQRAQSASSKPRGPT